MPLCIGGEHAYRSQARESCSLVLCASAERLRSEARLARAHRRGGRGRHLEPSASKDRSAVEVSCSIAFHPFRTEEMACIIPSSRNWLSPDTFCGPYSRPASAEMFAERTLRKDYAPESQETITVLRTGDMFCSLSFFPIWGAPEPFSAVAASPDCCVVYVRGVHEAKSIPKVLLKEMRVELGRELQARLTALIATATATPSKEAKDSGPSAVTLIGKGQLVHFGYGNDVPRHTFGDTYTDEGDDGILLGSRADEPAVLQLVGDGSRVGAAFRSIDAGTSDGRPTLGRRGWGAHKAAARRGGAPPVSTTIQAGIWPAQQSSGRRLRTLGLLHRQPVAPTEVVFEAASSLLFGMDNLNNGDPQFDPRASTTPAAEGTGRRGRSQRRHGERPATSQDPPPPEPTVDVPPAFRRPLAAPVPWASSFLPARMPTEPAQAPDCWERPASSQAGAADHQSAHDRRQLRETVGGCQTTVRDGGSLSELALQFGDGEGDDRRVPAA
eukprot:s6843_g3.t1